MFIKALLALFGTLRSVVIVQSLCAAISALVLAIILERSFQAARWICAIAALLYSIEPISLLHERLMLTETLATLGFTLFTGSALAYVRKPKLPWLAVLALLSAATIAARVSLLPVLVLAIVSVPILARFPAEAEPGGTSFRWRIRLIHLTAALVFTFACHAAYKQAFHRVTGKPAAYNTAGGLFLLAAWAPLVTLEDFPDPATGRQILAQLTVPLSDPFARPGQRFSHGGLIETLIAQTGNEDLADEEASKIVKSIMRRDPLGILRLGWNTYTDFWDQEVLSEVLRIEAGIHELDQHLIEYFHDVYQENLARHNQLNSLTKEWHRVATPWYHLVLLDLLFAVAAVLIITGKRPETLLILLLTSGLYAIILLPVTEAVVRYLHPLAWLTVLTLASLLSNFFPCTQQKSS